MKKIATVLTLATLTACSFSEKTSKTTDNTFIIKPMDIEHGHGDKRIIMSFTNKFNIEKKVTINFDGRSYATEIDLCENGDFSKQTKGDIPKYHCPFHIALQKVVDSEYRVLAKATFLNGFRVNAGNGTESYIPLAEFKEHNGILSMENNQMYFSFDSIDTKYEAKK